MRAGRPSLTAYDARMSEPDLAAALSAVYATFAAPKPARIVGCPCCLDRKGVCTLLAKRLRDLTADELSPYAASVFLTAGEVEDFRYFLPRLLELSITEPDWWPSEEVLLSRLSLAAWRNWPKAEQAVIEWLLQAWFGAALSDGSDAGERIDALVCGIARAGIETAPYLQHLLEPANLSALLGFHEANAQALAKKGRLRNPFWGDCPESAGAVIGFLRRQDVQAAIGNWRLSR